MNHYTQAEWLAYIKDELPKEERQQYDDHLYSCDHCLETYMSCVQENPVILPKSAPLQSKQWAEEVIRHQAAEDESSGKMGFQSRKLFVPYAVAASITLILTGAGVFESLITGTELIQNNPVTDSPISYSEKAVQTVTGWLDNFKK